MFDSRFDAFVLELRKRGYHFTGFYHQGGEYGVPVFDDGGWLRVSFRQWGAIMAKAFPEEVGTDKMAYIHWAWTWDDDQSLIKYPNPEDYQ